MDMQSDAEGRIISAAIMCIEEYGLQGATIRRIAEKAGLNSAAINYYFRSKDKLLEKAVDISLQNAFDWNDYQVPETSTVQERIEAVLMRLIEGAQTYPGLTRAHFFCAFSEGKYDQPGIKRFNQFLEELLQRIKPLCPGREESDIVWCLRRSWLPHS
jgi:AcrR family transcriptional regulator